MELKPDGLIGSRQIGDGARVVAMQTRHRLLTSRTGGGILDGCDNHRKAARWLSHYGIKAQRRGVRKQKRPLPGIPPRIRCLVVYPFDGGITKKLGRAVELTQIAGEN